MKISSSCIFQSFTNVFLVNTNINKVITIVRYSHDKCIRGNAESVFSEMNFKMLIYYSHTEEFQASCMYVHVIIFDLTYVMYMYLTAIEIQCNSYDAKL